MVAEAVVKACRLCGQVKRNRAAVVPERPRKRHHPSGTVLNRGKTALVACGRPSTTDVSRKFKFHEPAGNQRYHIRARPCCGGTASVPHRAWPFQNVTEAFWASRQDVAITSSAWASLPPVWGSKVVAATSPSWANATEIPAPLGSMIAASTSNGVGCEHPDDSGKEPVRGRGGPRGLGGIDGRSIRPPGSTPEF